MSTVSVHIVTFNSEADIRACLAAVFRQTVPVQSIIVVDNASTDGTRAVLCEYADGVQLVLNEQNRGFAGGHNQALALSDADFCLILNPDVTLSDEYIERLLAGVRLSDDIGSATGLLLRRERPETVDSTGLVISRTRRAFDRGAEDPAAAWTASGEVFGVSGAAALYARRMVADISIDGEFFDEDFFAYKEDVDVAWRARLAGWKAYYAAEATAVHGRGWKIGGRSKQSLRVRRLSYINRYKMLIKNERGYGLIRHLLPLIGYELLGFAYFALREPAVLGAWLTVPRQWRQLLHKRRSIQSKVCISAAELYHWFK